MGQKGTAWNRAEGSMWDRKGQHGIGQKVLCGTERDSMEEGRRLYVGQKGTAWKRAEGSMWDRKGQQEIGHKVLCGTERDSME